MITRVSSVSPRFARSISVSVPFPSPPSTLVSRVTASSVTVWMTADCSLHVMGQPPIHPAFRCSPRATIAPIGRHRCGDRRSALDLFVKVTHSSRSSRSGETGAAAARPSSIARCRLLSEARHRKIRRKLGQYLPARATWRHRLVVVARYHELREVLHSSDDRCAHRAPLCADPAVRGVLDVAARKTRGRPRRDQRRADSKTRIRRVCVSACLVSDLAKLCGRQATSSARNDSPLPRNPIAEPLGHRRAEIGERRARDRWRRRRAPAGRPRGAARSREHGPSSGVVGSLPWSAVMNKRSSGFRARHMAGSAASNSASAPAKPAVSFRWPYSWSKSTKFANRNPLADALRSHDLHERDPLGVARRVRRARCERPANRSSTLPTPGPRDAGRCERVEQRLARRLRSKNRAGSRCGETMGTRPRTAARSRATRRAAARASPARSRTRAYSSASGTTSSCAAIWNTESADVYTIHAPVLTCSSPNRAIDVGSRSYDVADHAAPGARERTRRCTSAESRPGTSEMAFAR